MLHVMLERREAELREAMKLRHSLTTLLHALRLDMDRVRNRHLTHATSKFIPKSSLFYLFFNYELITSCTKAFFIFYYYYFL